MALQNIQGFGPNRIDTLLNWRQKLEQKFRFDPSQAVSSFEIALIDQKYARRKKVLEEALASGLQELNRIRQNDVEQTRTSKGEIGVLLLKCGQAKADTGLFTWW